MTYESYLRNLKAKNPGLKTSQIKFTEEQFDKFVGQVWKKANKAGFDSGYKMGYDSSNMSDMPGRMGNIIDDILKGRKG